MPVPNPEPRAMTVRGPVPVSELGSTLVHEHLHIDARPLLAVHPYGAASDEPLSLANAAEARWNPGGFTDNYLQTDVDLVIEEVDAFRRAGGGCVVEVTPTHLGRSPEALRAISEATGLHVVMGGGYYLAGTMPAAERPSTAEQICAEFVADFVDGVGDLHIRPGIMGELGTGDPLKPDEALVLRGAALAQARTGLPISVHVQPWGSEGRAVLSVLEEAGADPDRVILGHMTTAIGDSDYQLELLGRGARLGYDLFGFDHSLVGPGRYPPSDHDVVLAMTRLAEAGFRDQLYVSHDVGGVKTRLLRYGGWGYAHIAEHVLPLFERAGWTPDDLDQLLVRNPARLLGIAAPPSGQEDAG